MSSFTNFYGFKVGFFTAGYKACTISARVPGKAAGQSCRAKLPGKAAGQSCRAKLPGKAAGQSCRAKLPGKTAGQDCWARLPGKTAGQDGRARRPGKTAGQDCMLSRVKNYLKIITILFHYRGLRNRAVTSSGAIAVLQIGFILTLANLRYFTQKLIVPLKGFEPASSQS
jgi:hypothetical protein